MAKVRRKSLPSPSAAAPVSAAVSSGPGLMGRIKQGVSKAVPGYKTDLAIGAASMIAPFLLSWANKNFGSESPWRQDPLLDAQIRLQRSLSAGDSIRSRRRQQMDTLIRQNMALLSQQSPSLAQQLMAGTVLPEDATVIGGQPRTDLLRSVAARMTMGEFSPSQPLPLPDHDAPGFPMGPDPMAMGGGPGSEMA